MKLITFIILYIVLAILCYFLYWEANFKFYRKGSEIELSYPEKRTLFIIMSILWIFYVPKLLIDYWKGK